MLVDTNILIDFLRGKQEAGSFIFSGTFEVSISIISITELFAGVRSQREIEEIQELLQTLHIHTLNEEIAEKAGNLLRKFGKSHQIGIADALIAASSIYHNDPLATLNIKDFPMLDNVLKPY
ncbi:MAG: type II toxin-antitoxin system VapC family toxin [Ignavibacteriota bacterium]